MDRDSIPKDRHMIFWPDRPPLLRLLFIRIKTHCKMTEMEEKVRPVSATLYKYGITT